MSPPTIDVRPLASAIGAEIFGIDLAEPVGDREWETIERAFHDHCVIFFRDQHITPEQHVAFSRRFGLLEEYPFVRGIEGHPELIEIVKMPNEVRNFGAGWHVDMSFRHTPPLGAVLYGTEVPAVGGDTMFANLYLAYETLSDGMRSIVDSVNGIHDSHEPANHSQSFRGMSLQAKEGMTRQLVTHPLYRTHPVTGRRSLFISPDYCTELDGMTLDESRLLLNHLEAHATRDEFTCRFRWQPNSIAIWDNRCTMQKALNDDLAARSGGAGFRRVMRRSTITDAA
jgi:taurine dioxygenase